MPTAPKGSPRRPGAAVAAGLAGFSIEDFRGDDADPIYELERATERVRAAAEVAHAGPARVVLTARAENYLHGRPDLDDTIARLQAYQEAGADVLYAPGPTSAEQIRAILSSVDRPVNVLARPGSPPVAELAQLGVSRISVGGSFAFAAAIECAGARRREELRDERGAFTATPSAVRGGRCAGQRAWTFRRDRRRRTPVWNCGDPCVRQRFCAWRREWHP